MSTPEQINKNQNPYYKAIPTSEDPNKPDGWELLRAMFPTGEGNEMNFCLFSTSGVHGTYNTIEECEMYVKNPKELDEYNDPAYCNMLTFVTVQPRIVCIRWGNIYVTTLEEVEYLKNLRETSWRAVSTIGFPGGNSEELA